MKFRIKLLLRYSFFWMVFFIFCRLIFLLYNFKLTFQLSGWEFLQTFWHGALLDISLTAIFYCFRRWF
jgi:hypothetical protein